MKKKSKTIAELESETGKFDSIRTIEGKNPRSDQFVDNFKKAAGEKATKLEAPSVMPQYITIGYKDGTYVALSAKQVKQLSTSAKSLGIIE